MYMCVGRACVCVNVCVCICVVCELMWDVVRVCGRVHICEVCVCCEGVCGCEIV